ncbi:uncharacterized protein LOC126843689 isoform X2 [Adelges cooleyi]|uniref:uncharacterized protein LOC126843689 isoform X2 n=1 Tax=Adelges cooleyi TaxID=133065 RepID=UPI00217FECAF|nr:uncharacterized protein LOC126843689 isoform X2 [Adelges cooleyi]
MNDCFQNGVIDLDLLSETNGFRFSQYSGPVDWENIEKIKVNDIVEKSDINGLLVLLNSILNYDVEKLSPSKKIFRLSQLIIDYLLYFSKSLSSKVNVNNTPNIQCELCGKQFSNTRYLHSHQIRRHKLDSCSNSCTNSFNEDIGSLKSELIELKSKLNTRLEVQNQSQTSAENIMTQPNFDCGDIHKNKLLYHPGDNPMQTQEMYWIQKYKCLEEKYNKLQHDCNNYQMLRKSPCVQDSYQQCNLYGTENCSKYIQTDSVLLNSNTKSVPEKLSQLNNEYLLDSPNRRVNNLTQDLVQGEDKPGLDNHLWNDEERLDRDFYELKKLRLEACMNRVSYDTSPDCSVSLLPADRITFILVLGKSIVNELFKNNGVLDLIKCDVKDIVTKRLEDYFSYNDNALTEEKDIVNNSSLIEKDSINEITTANDEVAEKKQHKDNVTVLSKLKKALRFKKSLSSDVNSKKLE